MKRLISLLLVLCLCLSMAGAGFAEGGKGTIMWLSNLSSGAQYDSTKAYLEALTDELGYKFSIVYGDMFNDAAGNLTAVSNGMTNDVVGIIASMDGGLKSIMEQYPNVYVAGYNTDMNSVFGGGENAVCLEMDHFLGTICDGFQDGADMGRQYFDVVVQKGYKKITVINFPGYAYPNQVAAVAAFTEALEAYNATASEDQKITMVSDPLTLEFQPLPDSYFLENGHDDLDCIVAFCAGISFVYPTLVTAKGNGFCRADTGLVTGGFENNADILADIGDDRTIAWINISPAEDPAYALVLLDNAVNGCQYSDFVSERVDSASYTIDSIEDIDNVMSKSLCGTADVALAQISVEEVKNLCVRFNADATYAGLKELFHSEQILVDALKNR